MNNFYVYVYLDPRKKGSYTYGKYSFEYEPFYVGKGKGNRYKQHLLECSLKYNNIKNNKIKLIIKNGLNPIILKIDKNLTEQKALNLEEYLIKKIGRIKLNSGPLTNLTNGGEGTNRIVVSDNHKNNMSKAAKNRNVNNICSYCKKSFVSNTGASKYCSNDCKNKFYKKYGVPKKDNLSKALQNRIYTLECQNCKNEFKSKTSVTIYCDKCLNIYILQGYCRKSALRLLNKKNNRINNNKQYKGENK